ncbi:MAG: DUF1588 domain-containing protein [Phycisphaeraceae bacterium]
MRCLLAIQQAGRPRFGGFIVGVFLALGLAVLSIGSRISIASDEAELPEQGVQEQERFETLVKPYLQQHCIKCHGPNLKRGEITLHGATGDFAGEEEVNDWLSVLDMLTFNDMPPPNEKQPDPKQTAEVIGWIKQRVEQVGVAKAYRAKLLAPEYGNYVNHEKLFSGEVDAQPYSPARFWRFSSDIFEARNYRDSRSPFTYVTPESDIRDYSAMSSVDASTVKMILINTEQWLEYRQKNGDFAAFADDKPIPSDDVLNARIRQEFKTIVRRDASQDEAAKYLTFLKENFEIGSSLDSYRTMLTAMFLSPESIFRMEFGMGPEDEYGRRHLSPEEIAYALAYALTDKGPDDTPAIKQAFKQGKLNKSEDVASVVERILDEELGTGTAVHSDVPRIMRFFEEYFGFDRAGDVFKDNTRKRLEVIPQWNTSYLVNDARRLIEFRLKEDKDVIARLLTGSEFFVAHPGDNDYAKEVYEATLAEVLHPDYVEDYVSDQRQRLLKHPKAKDADYVSLRIEREREKAQNKVERFKQALADGLKPFPSYPFSRGRHGIADLIYIVPYSLPASRRDEHQRWAWEYEQPIQMPKQQRAGILTHPAWLAAHSWNDGNDPIHRGIWVQKKLLAGVIQDVPPDVDAKVPSDPHKTLRERMDVLREERCWTCHRKINPLGEPFEVFDDWGRYRTQDYFDEDGKLVTRRDGVFEQMLKEGKLKAKPINATGSIKGSGDPAVDGDVQDAIEMMHRLGHSDRARQAFIRHLFRYFMGRNEMLSDSKTLIEAEQAYLENGGSFKALVVSLLSSDSFLYRK